MAITAIDTDLYRCNHCYTVIALEPDRNRPKTCHCGNRNYTKINIAQDYDEKRKP